MTELGYEGAERRTSASVERCMTAGMTSYTL
jgi:hypothetical protein